jgi:hypothetical protein
VPRKLGQAFQTAVISPAGRTNAGNWTATFDSPDIGIFLPEFDCYHIVIKGGPAGSTFDIYVNNNLYDSVTPGDTNSWDPNHPMKLSNGDSVIFYWNAGTGTAPTVWLYFQEPELL